MVNGRYAVLLTSKYDAGIIDVRIDLDNSTEDGECAAIECRWCTDGAVPFLGSEREDTARAQLQFTREVKLTFRSNE